MYSPVLKDIKLVEICRSFIHYAFPLDVMSPYGQRFSGLSNYTDFWVMSASIMGLTKTEQQALNAEKEVQRRALQDKRLTDAELTTAFADDVHIFWADKTLRRAYFTELEALVNDGVVSSELWPYLDDCLTIGYDIWCSEWTRAMETLWKSGNGHACRWATEDGFQKRFDEAALQERNRIEEERQDAIEKATLEERVRIERGW